MKRRMTINIDDGLPDEVAVDMVLRVIHMGRISGDGTTYCYASTCALSDGSEGVIVANRTRAGNDTFSVYRKERGL